MQEYGDFLGYNMTFSVMYEDESVLVLNKPAGVTVNRADTTKNEITVQEWVEDYLKIPKSEIPNTSQKQNTHNQESLECIGSDVEFLHRSGIVHRLDKETSGILLIAKTLTAFENLQKQFKERLVKKTYSALVHGRVLPEEGIINAPVGRQSWNRKRFGVVAGGREALTRYKTIRNITSKTQKETLTLLGLYPETGRTHQIRVHLKYIGYPIFGDPLYAGRKTSRTDRKILSRVFLHASKISFFHPQTEKSVTFESELPNELQQVLEEV